MIDAMKVAACIKFSFFDQNFLGLQLAFISPQYLSVRRPPGQALRTSSGLFFFYMNFENSPYHRLCKSNVAIVVCYIQVKFVYSGSMLAI